MLDRFGLRGVLAIVAGFAAYAPAFAVEPDLIAAAKQEGSVTVYTVMIDQVARPLAEAFEAKYGIKVNSVRAGALEIVRRMSDEAEAGRVQVDIIDGSTYVTPLKQRNLLLDWLPETAANLPKQFVDPDRYWSGVYVLVSVPAINTTLVPAAAEPKDWNDLLLPAWKNKMEWSADIANTGAAGFVGLMLRDKGEENARAFLTRLAGQNIAGIPQTPQVLNQLVAGEYPLAIMVAVHQVLSAASKGAPVKWLPFSPVIEGLVTSSLARNAPHPNAAKLYDTFLLSDAGQSIFRDNYYIPTSTHIIAKDPRALPNGNPTRGLFFTPEELTANISGWQRIASELFR